MLKCKHFSYTYHEERENEKEKIQMISKVSFTFYCVLATRNRFEFLLGI